MLFIKLALEDSGGNLSFCKFPPCVKTTGFLQVPMEQCFYGRMSFMTDLQGI